MPRGDGTGPLGLGTLTGRRLGPCAGYPAPGWLFAARNCWAVLGGLWGAGRWAAGLVPRFGRGRPAGRGVGGRNWGL